MTESREEKRREEMNIPVEGDERGKGEIRFMADE